MRDDGGVEQELVGEVVDLLWADEGSGWAVVALDTGEVEEARATGQLAALVPGQAVRLVGEWSQHPRHGPTFKAEWYEAARPRSLEALVAFLSSARFPGVGTAKAQRLVDAFGLELGTVALEQPERLAAVPGFSGKLAEVVVEGWRRTGDLAELVTLLGGVGLPPTVAQAVLRRFGEDALPTATTDPYRFLAVPRVGWSHAEALAHKAGIDRRDPVRLRAGVVTALREDLARGGHTWTAEDELRRGAQRLLGVDERDLTAALRAARDQLVRQDGQLPAWYLAADHAAEVAIAADVPRLRAAARPAKSARVRQGELTDEQQQAVLLAMTEGLALLHGGPGTGKTHTVRAIVHAALDAKERVALSAPTGRAARRLEEVTGHAAGTIHRLLEAYPLPGGGFGFRRAAAEPLSCDLLIVDETSMADLHLMAALLEAVPDGARVLLVGDPHQLPPVGGGAVLRDLLMTAEVPDVALTEVHRQAATSRIVTLAHEIDAGTAGAPVGRDGDVFAVPERSAGIASRVAGIVAETGPAYFGCAPADIQVLAPMYKGLAGIDALNAALKERLNPGADRPLVAGFHEGDRVVQLRNDPELEVANGDLGVVIATDRTARTLEVAFPFATVTYTAEQAGDLAPGWCLSVHKAQGGEWPVVVLVLDQGHARMLTRELVYTGVSRARTGLLLVGDPALLARAARRSDGGLAARRTGLQARLAKSLSGGRGAHVRRAGADTGRRR